ncbi:MAG: hypothetical protein ACYC96_09975 [Fimbriimonadaceae bacterium]
MTLLGTNLSIRIRVLIGHLLKFGPLIMLLLRRYLTAATGLQSKRARG